MNRPRARIFWTAFGIALLIFGLLLIFAPEVLYCNPLVFTVLRHIPDGCLRWHK